VTRSGSIEGTKNSSNVKVSLSPAVDPNLNTFTVVRWTSVSRNITRPYDLVFTLRPDIRRLRKKQQKQFGWKYVIAPSKVKIVGNVKSIGRPNGVHLPFCARAIVRARHSQPQGADRSERGAARRSWALRDSSPDQTDEDFQHTQVTNLKGRREGTWLDCAGQAASARRRGDRIEQLFVAVH
jgi:hypothetical protein